MGVFYKMRQVRNLAPIPLSVRYDGQETAIPPGVSGIPEVCVMHAMNQNPIMGQANPNNPSMSGGKYLIVPVDSKYDREPLTQKEWEEHLNRPCRMDEAAYFEDRLGPKESVVVRGKGRKTQARSSFDDGVRPNAISENVFESAR